MITCYFDDSGKENDSNFVCMAGYIATEHYWEKFHSQWKHMLLKHGIRYVHMKELIGLNGEYKLKNFTIQYRDMLAADFIKIIKETELIGFGVGIDAKYWQTMNHSRRKEYGNAQEFCLQSLLRQIIDRLDKARNRDTVSLIYDTDPDFASSRLKLFNTLIRRESSVRERVSAITFGNMMYYYGLQAADMLAWETRKELVQKVGGFESTIRFKDMMTILPGKWFDYSSELWDKSTIESELSKQESENNL